MVQPLRDSRDHYEELKQIDDAMTEVESIISIYLFSSVARLVRISHLSLVIYSL